MDRTKIIVLDTETTGLKPGKDEIVSIGVTNGYGEAIFYTLLKPRNNDTWEKAEAVHGISPEMVEYAPYAEDIVPLLQPLIDNANLILGYNFLHFDRKFLQAVGLKIPEEKVRDVMLEFSPIFGEWNHYFKDYKFQKLEVCCNYYGIQVDGLHNSLEDARATALCFLEQEDELEAIKEKKEREAGA